MTSAGTWKLAGDQLELSPVGRAENAGLSEHLKVHKPEGAFQPSLAGLIR
jgi:hypothetical protein